MSQHTDNYSTVLLTPQSPESERVTKDDIASFLYVHLDEYGDQKEDIFKCINYALNPEKGGFALVGMDGKEIIGAVIFNNTGMSGYIPENILVYIAMHRDYRGKGIGKWLMKHAIENSEGDIALHVEHNNPAKFLYEKLGFTNPYLEMRLKRS
jgi:ribosomal protein S18 acetylase RimI-like enzyme